MSITAFTSSIAATVRWSISGARDIGASSDAKSLVHSATKTFGTGAAQANLVWHDRITATATLNLSSLPRAAFGFSGSCSFTTVKTLRIKNAASSGSVIVGGAAFGLSSLSLSPSAIILLDSPAGWDAGVASISIQNATDVEVVIVGVGAVGG